MINKTNNFFIPFIFIALISFCSKSEDYILKAENWLNNLTTMTADFVQISSDGRIAEGKLYIKKGKGFRFEYSLPSNLLIVGRQNIVIVQDIKNKTSTNYPLFNNPLAKFLSDNVNLNQKGYITSSKNISGILKISIKSNKDQDGLLELEFSKKPFQLRKWKIIDKIGTEVNVTLQNHAFGFDLPNKTFRGFAFPANN
tara:strand:+ start:39 stop:632 length:594 start_codon:yes stop_codon:yes gene_type:complete